jgi:spore coat polysaccharide biosynthesis protein SpsF
VDAVAGRDLIGVVVQARMGSERLPGKVLRPLAGRPALDYVIERVSRAGEPDLVVVATSDDASDDPIAEHCAASGVEFHRGPLADVAARIGEVVERFDLSAFARVSGDSPLLDQRILDRAIARFREGNADVVTNVFPRTYPSGQSVEVVSRVTFEAALAEMDEPGDREHVTPFLYRHADRFEIVNLAADHDHGEIDMALDTAADAELIEAMLARMERPHWDYGCDELIRLLASVQEDDGG